MIILNTPCTKYISYWEKRKTCPLQEAVFMTATKHFMPLVLYMYSIGSGLERVDRSVRQNYPVDSNTNCQGRMRVGILLVIEGRCWLYVNAAKSSTNTVLILDTGKQIDKKEWEKVQFY